MNTQHPILGTQGTTMKTEHPLFGTQESVSNVQNNPFIQRVAEDHSSHIDMSNPWIAAFERSEHMPSAIMPEHQSVVEKFFSATFDIANGMFEFFFRLSPLNPSQHDMAQAVYFGVIFAVCFFGSIFAVTKIILALNKKFNSQENTQKEDNRKQKDLLTRSLKRDTLIQAFTKSAKHNKFFLKQSKKITK